MHNVKQQVIVVVAVLLSFVNAGAQTCCTSGSCPTDMTPQPLSSGPTSQAPRAAPSVTVLPNLESFRDAARASVTAGYATPTYTSMDIPRAIAIAYSSSLADPRVLLQVDATPVGTDLPVRLSLIVRNDAGSLVQFANGSTELFYQAHTSRQRLAAQFVEPRMESRSNVYGVVVRSWWGDGTYLEAAPVRVRTANISERSSPLGRGWYVVGLPRLVVQSDGIHLVENGTGTWFSSSCTTPGCTFASPGGEFSTLARSDSTYERRYRDGSVDVFLIDGLLRSRLDRHGNATTFHWTGQRLDSIQDPTRRSIRFGYGAEGLAWIDDPAGRRTSVTVSPFGTLTEIRDPLGRAVFNAGYDSQYRMLWRRDQAGRQWDFTYDAPRKLAAVIAPQIHTTDAGLTRPITRFVSVEAALLPGVGQGTWVDPGPVRNPDEVQVSVTDARGHTTLTLLDEFEAPKKITDPLGRVSYVTRNSAGQVVRTISFAQDTTYFVYDGPALVRTFDCKAGTDVQMTYTADHQTLTVVGAPATIRNEYERDSTHAAGSGGKLLFSYAGPQVTAFEYWDHRPHHVYGPGARHSYYYEDTAGSAVNLSFVISEVGFTFFHRDALGRVVKTRNTPEWNVRGDSSLVEYDILNRPLAETDPAGFRTLYSYGDSVSRVTDARGQVYETSYNAVGWPLRRVDPRGQVETFGYDRNGNLTAHTNRRGQTVTFGYDVLNRLRWRDADGQRTTFDPNSTGALMVIANPESLDSLVITPADPSPGFLAMRQVTTRGGARFALRSRIVGSTPPTTWSEGSWTSYSVGFGLMNDESGRITDVCTPYDLMCWNRPTRLEYESPQRRVRIINGPDTVRVDGGAIRYSRRSVDDVLGVIHSRDRMNRVIARRNPAGDSTRAFQFDRRGQLISRTDSIRVESEPCQSVELTDPCWSLPPLTHDVLQRAYSYDAVGNRTDSDAVVQLGNRMQYFAGVSMSYDADGNLIQKFGPGLSQRLTWNSLGQLAQATTNGQIVTFGYDGRGRRVRKTVNGVTTRYIYDRQHVVAETDAVGNVLTEYFYFPGDDRPHSLVRGGHRYLYLTDGPGNVVGLVDSYGNVVNEYRYGPWGEHELVRETVPQPLRFTAREYDSETGFYYYRARYYDPELGRFISEDPIGLAGGINPYAYVANDPVNARDPSGLCPKWANAVGVGIGIPGQTGVVIQWFPCPGRLGDFYKFILEKMLEGELDCRTYTACSDPATEEALIQQILLEASARSEQERLDKLEAAMRSTPANDAEAVAYGVKDALAPWTPVLNAGATLALAPVVLTTPQLTLGTRMSALTIQTVPERLLAQGLRYHPRVEATDLYHAFPRALDPDIIRFGAHAQRITDRAHWFRMQGTVGETTGWYELGINDASVIFHRMFRPY